MHFFLWVLNTINKNLVNYHHAKPKIVKPIKTRTLDSILEDTKFKNEKISLLSIDTEGSELEVLEGFNLNKYSPDIIVVEYLDLKQKQRRATQDKVSSGKNLAC